METKGFYDRISGAYDLIADASEGACRERGLEALGASPGERVLELGFGTGHALASLGDAVGPTGRVYGLDISRGMADVALARVRARRNVCLLLGDARALCFREATFDAAFMSFALELFDAATIQAVLAGIHKTLRPRGRLGVVSMAETNQTNAATEIYHWLHRCFPHWVDCRPINLVAELERAGFQVADRRTMAIWGLPVVVAVGTKSRRG